MEWQLQDAESQFSRIAQKAQSEGPQIVTLRGERTVVALSTADYDALCAGRPSLVDDLLAGPAWDEELAGLVARQRRRTLMYLLDTNIFSEAGCGSAPAISWLRPVNSTSGHLSTMTRGEIMRGIALRQKSDPRRANHLVEGLRKPRPARAGRIPRVTGPICIGRGRIAPTRSRGDINGLIAAAAMVHDLILVIRNVADFDGTGASVINPWKVKT